MTWGQLCFLWGDAEVAKSTMWQYRDVKETMKLNNVGLSFEMSQQAVNTVWKNIIITYIHAVRTCRQKKREKTWDKQPSCRRRRPSVCYGLARLTTSIWMITVNVGEGWGMGVGKHQYVSMLPLHKPSLPSAPGGEEKDKYQTQDFKASLQYIKKKLLTDWWEVKLYGSTWIKMMRI